MEMISKNIGKGPPIKDLRELLVLANEKKSAIVCLGQNTMFVRPAAWLVHWSLQRLSNVSIFHSVKINNSDSDSTTTSTTTE